MALIKCKECNHEVSDKAATCPHCGVSLKPAVLTRKRVWITISTLVVALFGAVYMLNRTAEGNSAVIMCQSKVFVELPTNPVPAFVSQDVKHEAWNKMRINGEVVAFSPIENKVMMRNYECVLDGGKLTRWSVI